MDQLSIDLENAAMGCGVAEAAVIGVHHPKMGRAAALIVRRRKDAEVTKADLLKFLDGKIANGGCRTTCSSSTPSRTAPPADPEDLRCASTGNQAADGVAGQDGSPPPRRPSVDVALKNRAVTTLASYAGVWSAGERDPAAAEDSHAAA